MCDKYQHRWLVSSPGSRVSWSSLNSVGSILTRDLSVFVWMIWWIASGDDFIDWIHMHKTNYFNDGTCADSLENAEPNDKLLSFKCYCVFVVDHITRCISPIIIIKGNSDDLFDLCLGLCMCTVSDEMIDSKIGASCYHARIWCCLLSSVFGLMFADRSINFIPVEMISMQMQSTLTTVLSRIKWEIDFQLWKSFNTQVGIGIGIVFTLNLIFI